jgi:hypothetical protein
MATEVKRRRGTTAQHVTFTGAEAELTVDTEKWTVLVHDDSGSAPTGKELLRQDFSNVTTLKVNTTYSETGNEVQGEMYWNPDEETVSLVTNGSTLELGHKTEVHVRNDDPDQETIDKGSVVNAYGTIGNSGRIKVKKFQAGIDDTKTILGITDEDIAYGGDGKAIVFGKIRKIDTATPESGTWQEGDILYASSTAGALTKTQPTAGNVELPIAYVVNKHQNVGEIFVRITPIDENAYQAYDADLSAIAALAKTDGNFIVGNGSAWVTESGATARTSLGLGNVENVALSTYTGQGGSLDNQYITNGAGYITGYTETDPVFSASEAASITSTDTTQWDAAYTYSQVGHLPLSGGTITSDLTISGNLTVSGTTTTVNSTSVTVADNNLTLNAGETGAGVTQATSGIVVDRGTEADFAFLFVESDDKFKVGTSGNLQTVATRQDDGTATDGGIMYFNNTDKRLDNSSNATLDASGNLTLAGTISASGYNNSNWDTAFGWGNHASAGYLTSYTETDTLSDVTGRGASTTDPITIDTSSASSGNVLSLLGSAGNINFSYTGRTITFSSVGTITAGSNDLTLAGSQVVVDTNLYNDGNATVTGSVTAGSIIKDGGTSAQFLKADGSVDSNTYLTSLPTHNHNNLYYTELEINEFLDGTNAISGYNKSNWDTAFGWGNHASAGYLTSYTETDPVFSASAASGITSTNINNWNLAYNNHITAVGFNTSTGVLTLTQNDTGTITVDLDGRYLTTETGDIQGVTAGNGLSGGGTSGTVTLAVDFSELPSNPAVSIDTTDQIIWYETGSGTENRTNISSFPLSKFNNDSGFTSNVGDITAVTAGTGISGGGTSGSVTVSHATTSTLEGSYGSTSDGTKIDSITVDAFGHVTAISTGAVGDITGVTAGTGLSGGGTSGTVTLNVSGLTTSEFSAATILNSAETFTSSDAVIMTSAAIESYVTGLGYTTNTGDITGVTAGSGLSGGGTSGTVELSHADTSSQGSVNNSNGTVIQDVTLDTYGHVTGLVSYNLDGRYYTETEVDTILDDYLTSIPSQYLTETEGDARYLQLTGGSLTGVLDFNNVSGRAITITADTYLDGRDASIYLGNATSNYGWDLEYQGSGSGNNNKLRFVSTNNGTPKVAFEATQDGVVNLAQSGATIAGNTIFHDGYHPNADRLTTSREIILGGDLTGSAFFDGSSDITISAQVSNNSHTHDDRYLQLSGGTLTGNLEISNGSPTIAFETGATHYNWQIGAQENVDAGFEISVGSQDANAGDDTFSPKLVVKQSGNVGIGTSSPSHNLTINSATGGQLQFQYNTSNLLRIEADSGGGSYYAAAGFYHRFFTSGNERMRIGSGGDISFRDSGASEAFYWDASAGSLGIGTDSPAFSNGSGLEIEKAGIATLRLQNTSTAKATEIIQGTNFEIDTLNSGMDIILDATTDTIFEIANNEIARINSTGLGIGTGATVDDKFHIIGTSTKIQELGQTGITMKFNHGNNASVNSDINIANIKSFVSSGSSGFEGGGLTFETKPTAGSATPRMTIDSSGNVLVGKNTSGVANTGAELRSGSSNHAVIATSDSEIPMLVNRKTNDGDLIKFYKDGSAVGSIGTSVGSTYIGGNSDGAIYFNGITDIRPWNKSTQANLDNSIDLGTSSARFKDLYLGGNANIDGDLEVGGDVTFTNLSTTTGTTVITYDQGGNLGARVLGSNAFDSTSYLPLTGGTLTGGLTVTDSGTGIKIDTGGHASLRLDRASLAYDNNILFYTAGSLKWRLWQDASDDTLMIRDEVNSSNMVTFKTGGNVGIGTTDPLYPFSLESATSGLISRIYNTNADGQGLLIRAGATSSATRVLQVASSNDTKIMTVNSNGNVGIGTTSPNAKLNVDNGHFLRTRSTNTSQENIILQGAGYYIGSTLYGNVSIRSDYNNTSNQADLRFYTGTGASNTDEKMRILANGDIAFYNDANSQGLFWDASAGSLGIGTTIPYSNLTVIPSTNPTSVATATQLSLGEASANSAYALKVGYFLESGVYKSSIQSISNAAGAILVLNGDGGNVGIGTTGPTSKLSITDSATMYAAADGILLDVKRNASNGGDTTGRVGLRLANNSNGFNIYYGGTTDRLRFVDGGNNEVLSLKNGGNVGIGATNPAQKLVVNGGVHAYGNISTPASGTYGLLMDFYIADSRFWSRGTTGGGTRGAFKFYQLEADGTNQITSFALDNSGNATFNYDVDISGSLGVDQTNPQGLVHIGNGSGASAYQSGNGGLTIERSGRAAINLLTPNTSDAYIFFADPQASNAGYVGYEHANDRMVFRSQDDFYFAGNNVGIGTANPAHQLQVEGGSSESILNLTTTGYANGLDVIMGTDGHAAFWLRENSYIHFGTNNTERMRIDSSGNVGIGTTNIANNSDYSALRLGATASMWAYKPTINGNLFINENITAQDGNYIRSDFATSYRQGDGTHKWYNAPSGTAGTSVTLTPRMTIDSSGNVLVGKTDTARADVGVVLSSTQNRMTVDGNEALELVRNTNDGDILQFFRTNTQVGSIASVATGKIGFYGSGGTGAVIDSSGNVGIGVSPSHKLDVLINDSTVFNSSATSSSRVLNLKNSSTAAGASSGLVLDVSGTGSSGVATLHCVDTGSARGDLVFGTRGADGIAERMRIDSSGNVLMGTINTTWQTVAGLRYFNGSSLSVTRNGGESLNLNRLSSDGDIATFRKDGTTVGSIGTIFSDLFIGTNDSGLRFEYAGTNAIVPFDVNSVAVSDNATDLGASNARFKDLYLGGDLYVDGTLAIGSTTLADDTIVVRKNVAGTFQGLVIDNSRGTLDETGNIAKLAFQHNSVNAGEIRSVTTEDFTVSANRSADLSFHTIYNGTLSQRLTINDNGNVGIGTAPSAKLDIVADSVSGLKIGTNSEGGATLTTYQGSTNSNVRQLEINCQNFEVNTGSPTGTSTSNAFLIDSSGNVGIGVSPSAKLHLYKTGTSDNILNIQNGQDYYASILSLTANNDGGAIYNSLQSATNGGTQHWKIWGGGVASTMAFSTGGTERMRILSSGGITFNGDTATANALDDYEEGTFTPSIHAGASSPIYNSNNYGKYTKVGNVVHCSGRFQVDEIIQGSSSTSVELGGFPFVANTPLDSGTGAVAGVIGFASGFDGKSPTMMQIRDNETNALLYYQNASLGISNLKGDDFANEGSHIIVFQITYHTA